MNSALRRDILMLPIVHLAEVQHVRPTRAPGPGRAPAGRAPSSWAALSRLAVLVLAADAQQIVRIDECRAQASLAGRGAEQGSRAAPASVRPSLRPYIEASVPCNSTGRAIAAALCGLFAASLRLQVL